MINIKTTFEINNGLVKSLIKQFWEFSAISCQVSKLFKFKFCNKKYIYFIIFLAIFKFLQVEGVI